MDNYKPEAMFSFEDTYGHGKRLHFIKQSIEDYCQKNNKDKKNIKILDIGCGTGIGITFPIASLGYKIIGVDIDKNSIHYANKINIYPKADFVAGDLKDLMDLTDFDIIICSEVLEHVSNPEDFLMFLTTRIKSDGIIILTVPNGYSWFEFENFCYNKLAIKFLLKYLIKFYILPVNKNALPLITFNKNDKHIQRFSYNSLKDLLAKVELKITQQRKATLFGGPVSEALFWWCKPLLKLNNWLGNKSPYFLATDWYLILKRTNSFKIKSKT